MSLVLGIWYFVLGNLSYYWIKYFVSIQKSLPLGGLRNILLICDALRDLVAFVQFKRREKHTWRSVNFSKVTGWSVFHVF